MYDDDPRKILQPDTMLRMCQSPAGKALVKDAIIKAKVAMSATGVMDYMNEIGALGRTLSAQEQQDICSVIYHCMVTAKHNEVISYISGIPDECMNIGLTDELVGSA